MSWSINEVATMSGVTSRTLRHYDHIGLLAQLVALRRHHQQLLDEGERLHRLAVTVATTIAYLERGFAMPAEGMFDGFAVTPDKLAELEATAAEQGWGRAGRLARAGGRRRGLREKPANLDD